MTARLLVAALVFVAAALLFSLAPSIDLWVSGHFWRAEDGFFLRDWEPVRVSYEGIPYLTRTLAAAGFVLLGWRIVRRTSLFGVDGKRAAFLLLALAIGPGLLTNVVLKDQWGRARPSQIVEFGGAKAFTPPLVPASECERNCSFVAGHAAMGFYLVAFALLLPPRRRRSAELASIAFGTVVGLGRVAQGGHFLSDVVFSGIFNYAAIVLLWHAIVMRDALASPLAARLCRMTGALAGIVGRVAARHGGGLGAASIATVLAVAVSMAYLDRPLALHFRRKSGDLKDLFEIITQAAVSTGYLVGCALLFVAFRWAARDDRLATTTRRLLSAWSWIALYVFVCVAVSGLTVNLLKIVFGRTRPKLLDGRGLFEFTWGAFRADHWSFPSGHAATIAALMTALYVLWPRHVAAYVIVGTVIAFARVVVGAHYVSDVVAGAFLAVLISLYLRTVFERSGIDLGRALAGEPPPSPPRFAWRPPQRYPLKPESS